MEVRKYESILILNPDLSEGQLKEELQKIEAFILKNGGRKVAFEQLGKRPIPHGVRGFSYGFFVQVNFEAQNGEIIELYRRQLVITEAVLRHHTVRLATRVRKVKARPVRPGVSRDDDFVFGGDIDYI